MRVILRENIENLGRKGDIVHVAAGYGRNYLIPKKIAIEVTSRNMKMIEIEQEALQKGFEKERASYQELIDRLNAVTLSFTRKTSEKDVIFGSVSSTDIRDALASQGIDVEKKKILLDEPLKRLGNYTVPIKIFHEEKAEVKIEVVKEGVSDIKEERKETEPVPAAVEEGAAGSESVEESKEVPEGEEKKEGEVSPEVKKAQELPVDSLEEDSGENSKTSGASKEGKKENPEKSEESTEDIAEMSEEIKDRKENGSKVSEEPERTAEEDKNLGAASKDDK